MKKLLLLPTVFITLTVLAQNDTVDVESLKPIEEVFRGETDKEPEFPGGASDMMTWIGDNIIYPAQAVKDSIEGKVYVQFVVEIDGSLSEIKVVRSPDDSLSSEVIRMVKSMPLWSPGQFEGKAVRVRYILPVNFTLK